MAQHPKAVKINEDGAVAGWEGWEGGGASQAGQLINFVNRDPKARMGIARQ